MEPHNDCLIHPVLRIVLRTLTEGSEMKTDISGIS